MKLDGKDQDGHNVCFDFVGCNRLTCQKGNKKRRLVGWPPVTEMF